MMTTNNEDVKRQLDKSVYADMQKVINIYIQSLNNNLVPEEYRISNIDKLRGIGKYIFSPQMDAAIKAMFIHTMNKTVPAAYVSYESVYNPRLGCNELKVIDLLERPIKMQQMFVNDVVEAASYF